MDSLWRVTITRTFWGAGEEWTYVVVASGDVEAIEKAKRINDDYQRLPSYKGSQPTGTWEFYAEVLQPGEVAHKTWGGW